MDNYAKLRALAKTAFGTDRMTGKPLASPADSDKAINMAHNLLDKQNDIHLYGYWDGLRDCHNS